MYVHTCWFKYTLKFRKHLMSTPFLDLDRESGTRVPKGPANPLQTAVLG